MNKRAIRNILSVVIVIVTVVLFVRYFQAHPEYLRQLGKVSPWTIVWIILLNCAMIAILIGVGSATIQLCGKRLKLKENFLLTAYSSIANFFGPLQSGPGVRAVYLKAKHQVRLRDYTLGSLIALGLFAFYNALFLLVGTRPWWQTIGAMIVVAGISYVVIKLFLKRDRAPTESQFALRPKVLAMLMVFTFMQALVTVGWYYVELKAVNPDVRVSQALSYSGAANFSLFVSLTPDGIGIREAFLVYSQHIHQVPTEDIVSANVIDRAAYMLFLALLFLVVLSLHAKSKLGITKDPQVPAAVDEQ